MWRYASLSVILLLPSLAGAAPRTFSELAGTIVTLINGAVGVLIVAGLVIYFWGISRNIVNFGGTESKAHIKNYFIWGIVVLFVMVSIWGIVEIIQNSLFAGSSVAPNGQPIESDGSFNAPRFSE
jgi:hypothetical protein